MVCPRLPFWMTHCDRHYNRCLAAQERSRWKNKSQGNSPAFDTSKK